MKTLFSTLTLVLLSLLFMNFSSPIIAADDGAVIVEGCEECFDLVQQFDLLTPPEANECIPQDAYDNINRAIDNYNPESCYSLYSLFYNTITFYTYQVDCLGQDFCSEIMCEARCMSECLAMDPDYETSMNYVLDYLENVCSCGEGDCYAGCADSCEEDLDCCDTNYKIIPWFVEEGCCAFRISANAPDGCNQLVHVSFDADAYPEGCFSSSNDTGPGSTGDAIIKICCYDEEAGSPIIKFRTNGNCEQIEFDPRKEVSCP